MKSCLWIALLVTLVIGTKTQDDPITTIPKQPKEPAKDPNPVPGKPAVVPPKDGGTGTKHWIYPFNFLCGGSFGDNDLFDFSDNDNYKPDPGKGGGARAADPAPSDPNGTSLIALTVCEEAGSGQIAAIVSGIGVALLGAASSYFAYQKKKLCFKVQGGEDPESGKNAHGAQSDPQGKH
uniref:CD99 molecule n=1 Tax=Oncorhynchus mykiss TaxID=8022 RepID=A0A8C7VS68_ONCMY